MITIYLHLCKLVKQLKMKVLRSILELKESLEINRLTLQDIGFVPTMGALHDGHISLINCALKDNPLVIVSIFVNPEQFNDNQDFIRYPRPETDDLALLAGCLRDSDVVFIPDVNEIYPDRDNRIFDLGHLDRVMEGIHRPGHFNGVAKVVSILFTLVGKCNAYFGEKDFQQLAVIRKLVSDYHFAVQIIACPTIREQDGLAMSSRNRLLTAEYREKASAIPRALNWAQEMAGRLSCNDIKSGVWARIEEAGLIPEYVEIADENNFQPVYDSSRNITLRIFVAVKAGNVRLIDNMKLFL